jgi:hypothetical protein
VEITEHAKRRYKERVLHDRSAQDVNELILADIARAVPVSDCKMSFFGIVFLVRDGKLITVYQE